MLVQYRLNTVSLTRSAFCLRLLAAAAIQAALAATHVYAAAPAANATPTKTAKPVTDWCPALTARLPKVSVADCRNAQLKPTGVNSLNGFPVLFRDMPADARHPGAIRVLLLGGIHGDEQTASSIVFKWMELLQRPGAAEFNWRVAPVVNPDGLLAVKAKRVNARGIDLNRNFPTPNWEKEAPAYWARVTRKDPRRFPGKKPVSEPESRWVYDTIEHYKPDVIISVHAPFGVLDFDGPTDPPTRFGRLVYNRVGIYPGSLGNYSGIHKDIPVVTIELPHALTMPSDAEVQRIWTDMQKWIRQHIAAPLKTAGKS